MSSTPPNSRAILENQRSQLAQILISYSHTEARYNAIMGKYLEQPKAPWRAKKVLSLQTVVAGAIVVALLSIPFFKFLLPIAISVGLIVIGVYFLKNRALPHKLGLIGIVHGSIFPLLIVLSPLLAHVFNFRFIYVPTMFASAFTLMLLHNAYVPVANNKIAQENNRKLTSARKLASGEIAPVATELDRIREAYAKGNFAELMPEKYNNIESVHALLDIVKDHRASTIQEAVNCYVEDMHREYMRKFADRQIAISELQLEEQKRTTRAVHFANVMNIGMQAFQGARTRAAIQDGTNRISSQLGSINSNVGSINSNVGDIRSDVSSINRKLPG